MAQDEINKLVIFFATRYTFPDLNTYHKEQLRVAQVINMWTNAHPYTNDEAKLLVELDSHFKDILNCEFSHQVFGFELLALWSNSVPKKSRPFLNVSDAKLQKGSRYYMMEFISLKKKNAFIYRQKKEIVAKSVEVANEFWDFVTTYKREKVA